MKIFLELITRLKDFSPAIAKPILLVGRSPISYRSPKFYTGK
ncbi:MULTISPECIES: hypothetical protein [Planktothricoides]|uniref:Uncharacterized protein n=1 Tax=Planktothricoides raciborskii GIHE-MW2 TaxID=2792601 RepID=A0AAU8J7F9_9CYAN|nr:MULTISPECIES: hypothetical protein [Planktothricoides]